MNLVLDIDGTLVQQVSDEQAPALRPHVGSFLRFAFDHFSHVAVWSAANHEWVDDIIARLSEASGINLKERLVFIWAAENITFFTQFTMGDYHTRTTKKLAKVWKRFPAFTKHNTLILDDTPRTYCLNYGNAVPIPTWCGDKNDCELATLMNDRIPQWEAEFAQTNTVRCINKMQP